MKNFVCVLLSCPFLLFIGCADLSERICLLPDGSEWFFAQGGISFKVKEDSLFWKIDSDVQNVLPIEATAIYKMSHSGKICLQNKLPVLSGDLAYVCGNKAAVVFQFVSKAQQCKLEDTKLVFYSSDASLIFYRKK